MKRFLKERKMLHWLKVTCSLKWMGLVEGDLLDDFDELDDGDVLEETDVLDETEALDEDDALDE